MGHSPDAVVFYGYNLDTMIDPDDFCGTLAPSWLEPDDDDVWPEDPDERLRSVLPAGEANPNVEFGWYGSSEGDRTTYIAVDESQQQIEDWGCDPIDVAAMHAATAQNATAWRERLDRYVELMDLGRAVGKQEPGWHVAVSYG